MNSEDVDTLAYYKLKQERDQYKEMFDMQTKLVVDLEMRLLKMEEKSLKIAFYE